MRSLLVFVVLALAGCGAPAQDPAPVERTAPVEDPAPVEDSGGGAAEPAPGEGRVGRTTDEVESRFAWSADLAGDLALRIDVELPGGGDCMQRSAVETFAEDVEGRYLAMT